MRSARRLKSRLFGADPELVAAYRTVLPRNIYISFKKDNGVILAKISSFDDDKVKGLLITEAKSMDKLVSSINDLVYTYVKMPDNIRPYYGDVFQPVGSQKNTNELTLVRA